ncbi:MAG: hypothetical protein SFU84_03250 [Gemmatimonadales bacterium]|nr:hypothetical protein [Gemmatimonadales bacterium]
MTPDQWEMTRLTLAALGTGLLGYVLGRSRDSAKLIHERKADLISRFVKEAYLGQGLLWSFPFDRAEASRHSAAMAILAEELRIYVSRRTAGRIAFIVTMYQHAISAQHGLQVENVYGLGLRDDVDNYLITLRSGTTLLRGELGTASWWELIGAWLNWQVVTGRMRRWVVIRIRRAWRLTPWASGKAPNDPLPR